MSIGHAGAVEIEWVSMRGRPTEGFGLAVEPGHPARDGLYLASALVREVPLVDTRSHHDRREGRGEGGPTAKITVPFDPGPVSHFHA